MCDDDTDYGCMLYCNHVSHSTAVTSCSNKRHKDPALVTDGLTFPLRVTWWESDVAMWLGVCEGWTSDEVSSESNIGLQKAATETRFKRMSEKQSNLASTFTSLRGCGCDSNLTLQLSPSHRVSAGWAQTKPQSTAHMPCVRWSLPPHNIIQVVMVQLWHSLHVHQSSIAATACLQHYHN